MSASKNIVSISGEIQQETRVSTFGKDGKVAKNRISVTDERGYATYVPLVAWYERADELAKVRPGERILVDGQLAFAKPWKDRDGNERPGVLEVQVDRITIIGGKVENVEQYVDTEKIKFS